MSAAKKQELTEVKEMLPANVSELGGVAENFQGLAKLVLPFIKPEWQAKLFNFPDGNPVKTFEAVILRAEPFKTYWEKKLSDGGDKTAPDCSAVGMGGILQPPQGEHVQAASCAKCKWDKFGTSVNQDGTHGKGKRCADRLRFFVFVDGAIMPMQFGIPATSLFAWSNYVTGLKINYGGYVTKFSILPDKKGKAPGVINFEVARMCTQEEVGVVVELRKKFATAFGEAPVVEEAEPVSFAM